MSTPAGIQVAGVRRQFGGVVALDGVDLQVDPGEAVAIVGPSGAGKSTLLRILATLVTPDAGTVRVGGCDVVADGRSARRALGLVLGDERAWYWRLDGRRNLTFFATLHGLRGAAADARIDTTLDSVGLSRADAQRPVGEWSSGMRARLALARGLLHNPRVLLLDEPTRSLDVGAAQALRETLAVQRDRGTAMLLVTHDPDEAVALGPRVLVMAAGTLSEADGAAPPTAADVGDLVRGARR